MAFFPLILFYLVIFNKMEYTFLSNSRNVQLLTTKDTKVSQSSQKNLCVLCEKLCVLSGLKKVAHGVKFSRSKTLPAVLPNPAVHSGSDLPIFHRAEQFSILI